MLLDRRQRANRAESLNAAPLLSCTVLSPRDWSVPEILYMPSLLFRTITLVATTSFAELPPTVNALGVSAESAIGDRDKRGAKADAAVRQHSTARSPRNGDARQVLGGR